MNSRDIAAARSVADPGAARARHELARRQADLVAALVAGAPTPPGFNETKVRASASALLRKRAGEVAAVWPALSTSYGPQWHITFARWAAERPTLGALRDGWDLARSAATTGGLAPIAAAELAEREVRWSYDGTSAPQRRHLPAARRVPGGLLIQVFGKMLLVGGRRG